MSNFQNFAVFLNNWTKFRIFLAKPN